MIRVFTTEVCPKCGRLKDFLNNNGIRYEVMDMQSPEGMSELFARAVFVFDAPVLQVGEEFFTTKQMFKGVELNKEFILNVVTDDLNDIPDNNSIRQNMIAGE